MSLNYALEVQSPMVDLESDQQMIFNHGSLNFECRYPRTIEAGVSASFEPGNGNAIGHGEISYDMSVEMGNLGGMTKVTITPIHNLPNVTAQIIECQITSGDFEVWPIHSFYQGRVSKKFRGFQLGKSAVRNSLLSRAAVYSDMPRHFFGETK